MKNLLLRVSAALFLITCSVSLADRVQGQEISGKVKYHTVIDFTRYEEQLADPGISLERKRKIEDNIQWMKDVLEHSYILTFSNSESLFKHEPKLSLRNDDRPSEVMADFYKNFKDSIYIRDSEVSGRRFLIQDPLPIFEWRLHNETKTIGPYTCYKATYAVDQDVTEPIYNEDGTSEERVIRSQVTTTAWYTPQVPVMNGPYQYGGLPGLIMELSSDHNPAFNATIICTEVTLNPEKPVRIKKPTGRTVMTDSEFRAALDRMTK